MKTMNNASLSLLTLMVLWACSGDQEIIIQPGKGVQHDDFEYTVTGYEIVEVPQTGTEIPASENRYYLVGFKVSNWSARVDHRWDNSVVYLVDEAGNNYENNAELQKKLAEQRSVIWKEGYVTQPEMADSTILVFEVPRTFKQPYIKFRGSLLLGDVLSGNRFKRTKVKLFD